MESLKEGQVTAANKRHPGRGGSAWERVRSAVLAGSDVCAICGREIDREAPPRSRWSASVDHVVPLKTMRMLTALEQRQLALDPANLRAVHYGCNAKRGAGREVRRHVSRTASSW
jgi:5-methylcytosine-specific restriction endonuclease McrA